MQAGRFHLARSAVFFALSVAFVGGAQCRLLAQHESQLSGAQPAPSGSTAGAAVHGDPARTDGGEPPFTAASSSRIKLGPGDLIEVSVYNVPELTTKARVGNSGDIYLPLIDYVHVGGLSADEAQELIQKKLEDGGFVRNAHVSVYLDESASQHVTILGEVARPGVYPALADRRLYDFISAAGGFTAAAGRKITVIHEQGQSFTLDLPRNLGDGAHDNIAILAGDTISVAKAPIVYVVGDVGHPTGLLLDNGNLTVLQALALAGGTNHTAKMGAVRIIRKGAAGMTETKVPLKKMLEAKAPDINLQADDILFVPLSGARYAMAQGMQVAVSTAASVGVIAAHP
jgi:polysaccharide biosynthesis/export protein